jgi:hypothetical protein
LKKDGDFEEVVEEECNNQAIWENHQARCLEENEIHMMEEEEYRMVS